MLLISFALVHFNDMRVRKEDIKNKKLQNEYVKSNCSNYKHILSFVKGFLAASCFHVW
jgi:hypothetical protein